MAADQLISRRSSLHSDITTLTASVAQTIEFSTDWSDQIRQVELDVDSAVAEFEAAKTAFRDVVLRQAASATLRGEIPLIHRLDGIEGPTPRTDANRAAARRIEARAKLMTKMDELHKLRRKVFCLGHDDSCSWLWDDSAGFAEEESIVSLCGQLLDESLDSRHFLPQATVSSGLAGRLSEAFSVRFDEPHPVDFDLVTFHVPKGGIPEVATRRYHRRPIRALTDFSDVKAALDGFAVGGTLQTPPSSRIRAAVSRRLGSSQVVVNQLAEAMGRKVPMDVWTLQNEIHSRMREITQVLDDLIVKGIAHQKISSILPFGSDDIDTVEIETVSPAQIQRSQRLIMELQLDLLKIEFSNSEKILQFIDAVAGLKESAHFDDSETPSEAEDQQRLEVMPNLCEAQKADLAILTDVVQALPDAIKSQPGEYGPAKQATSIRLPPRLEVPPQTEPVDDGFVDAGAPLLEKIQKKQFGSRASPVPQTIVWQRSARRLSQMFRKWRRRCLDPANPK
jgi:hypothetical protein